MNRRAKPSGGEVRAYVRVSSRSQDHAMQRRVIEQAAKTRGDTIGHWYAEKRHAKTTARPELVQLMADAKRGEIRTLYVYRLDRLSRSGIRDTLQIVQELRAAGCKLVTLGDPFTDVETGPAGELVIALIAWAAQFEGNSIGERISRARERNEAEGKPWGRAPRMDPALIERARTMREKEKRTIREISIALKVPRSVVGRALAGTSLDNFATSGRLARTPLAWKALKAKDPAPQAHLPEHLRSVDAHTKQAVRELAKDRKRRSSAVPKTSPKKTATKPAKPKRATKR